MVPMNAIAIDTLRYVKRLKAAGFTEEQAEVQAEALSEAVSDSLVTKSDLNEAVEKLRLEMRDQHTSFIRWLVPLMVGQTALLAALVKLL
jgi:hypothetical protein